MEIPLLSADLIALLRKQHPPKHPSRLMMDRDIWIAAGKDELITMLETSLKLAEMKEKVIPQRR